MKKLILLIACIFLVTPLLCWSQGQIKRPTQSHQKTAPAKSIVSDPEGYIGGHGFIDLGLPSRKKWATNNLGASKAYETGNYFFWGESNNIKFGTRTQELIELKIIDNRGRIFPERDKVIKEWGKEWQTPTREEFEELLQFCKWERKNINGIRGYLVTGKNNKSIFFPFAGWISGSEPGKQVNDKNEEGYYLTQTYNIEGTLQDSFDTYYALCISCWQGSYPNVGKLQRATTGISIRPILKSN